MCDLETMAVVAREMDYIEKTVRMIHGSYGVNFEDALSRTIELLISSPYDPSKSKFSYYVSSYAKYACLNVYKDMMETDEYNDDYIENSYVDENYDIKTSIIALKEELEDLYLNDRKAFDFIFSALDGNSKITKAKRASNISSDVSHIYTLIKDSRYSINQLKQLMESISAVKQLA